MPKLVSRHLLWALVFSLLAHFLLLSGANFSLPDWYSEESIEVTLAPPPLPPPPKSAPERRPEPQSSPKPAIRPKPPTPQPVEPPKQEEAQVAPTAPAPVAQVEPAQQEPAPTSMADQEPAATAIQEEPVTVPSAPRKVEIDYQLFRGKGGTSVGKARQAFKLADDGVHYVLTSVAEASGLVSLFVRGKFEQRSEGLITDQGLRPQSFRQQQGNDKVQAANFNWELHTVALDADTRHSVVEVQGGTQDMLSFMYQFMFVPPLDEMRITVVNGKKLKTYAYVFEGEDRVETHMGVLRTWHIAKSAADGDEKTELWLAVDYRYLPIKIRQTDKDGTVTEQIATRLLLE
jgi:hypothetical protein